MESIANKTYIYGTELNKPLPVINVPNSLIQDIQSKMKALHDKFSQWEVQDEAHEMLDPKKEINKPLSIINVPNSLQQDIQSKIETTLEAIFAQSKEQDEVHEVLDPKFVTLPRKMNQSS